jgi:hypothetical protein
VRDPRMSRVPVESVTPRIDTQRRCRCAALIVWDEVYGWLHAAVSGAPCRVPQPAEP